MKTATSLIVITLGSLLAYLIYRAVAMPRLRHFSPFEFGLWYPLMSEDLLLKLDAFREAWGYPVEISGASGSLGRYGGDSHSQHNVSRWGEVRAADVFPKLSDGHGGYRYINSAEDRQRAYEVAKQVGFTGVGLYTDTEPGNMLHVDVREADTVAKWSRVNGQYRGIDEVLV